MAKYRKHRATGNPVGRPRVLPANLDEMVLASIKARINPETGLAKRSWMELAQEFGVSRSTISRIMEKFHRRGVIKSVYIPHPNNTDQCETFHKVLGADRKP